MVAAGEKDGGRKSVKNGARVQINLSKRAACASKTIKKAQNTKMYFAPE